jgi:Fe2+ transport system protein FeoA
MLRLIPDPDGSPLSEKYSSQPTEDMPEAPQMPGAIELSALGPGVDAVVIEVREFLHQQRLMEMGFVAGAPVRLLNSNDPAVLDLGGCRLAISRDILRNVLVF